MSFLHTYYIHITKGVTEEERKIEREMMRMMTRGRREREEDEGAGDGKEEEDGELCKDGS